MNPFRILLLGEKWTNEQNHQNLHIDINYIYFITKLPECNWHYNNCSHYTPSFLFLLISLLFPTFLGHFWELQIYGLFRSSTDVTVVRVFWCSPRKNLSDSEHVTKWATIVVSLDLSTCKNIFDFNIFMSKLKHVQERFHAYIKIFPNCNSWKWCTIYQTIWWHILKFW